MSLEQNAVVYTAQETGLNARSVMSVLNLILNEQCTVPFIARYRKEMTGNLDEIQIRAIHESYENYIEREKRREYILEAIKKMEQLTPDLEKKIKAASTINQLEDLYAPYKAKKKSKGMVAKEAGLEPLSQIILTGTKTINQSLKLILLKMLIPVHLISSLKLWPMIWRPRKLFVKISGKMQS
jgi:uncharacterized protein